MGDQYSVISISAIETVVSRYNPSEQNYLYTPSHFPNHAPDKKTIYLPFPLFAGLAFFSLFLSF